MTITLQREIKKKRPFELPEQEAMLNILRTADQLQIRFARLFRTFGLTPQQYNILRILRGEERPLPILEVAARMITVVPGITGLIDRLETAGLVERKRGEGRPLRFLEVAARMITVVPGFPGLIDRLKTAGFVERRRCDHDRRVVYVAIPPQAVELLGHIDEPLRELHKQTLGHMTKEEL